MKNDQVRIKLHIAKTGEIVVKNLWMCLNYDKKPTIEHICQHVKQTYVEEEKEQFSVNLFLDDYWLPSYENSSILRENDVIKVEINKVESKIETSKKLEKTHCKSVEIPQKLKSEYFSPDFDQHFNAHQNFQKVQPVYHVKRMDYNNHNDYFKNHSEIFEATMTEKTTKAKTEPKINSSKSSLNLFEQNTSVDSKYNQKKSQKIKYDSQQRQRSNDFIKSRPLSCFKKFSIGNYAHLLNEDVQEPVRDDDYTNENENKSETKSCQTRTNLADIDKIASNLKSTGQTKWKNSFKVNNKMPKHIRFPSSSSESSSSSSDSSSEEENGEIAKKKTEENNYYEPTKEEQLNAVSSNRSYVVKNPSDLNKFNQIFNSKQLNAPKAENFIDEILSEGQNNLLPQIVSKSSPKKERPSPSPKIDYEKFQTLDSAPRVNDRIAFKVLEISSSFTPEISSYKSGEVIDFDSSTNEVTLKLFSKYNSVLKRSSKFSVVFNETENEITKLKENECQPENYLDFIEQEQELVTFLIIIILYLKKN